MIDLGNRTSIYQPEQPNLQFPSEPEFNDVKATREDRKRRLVAACHAFATHGFDYGFAGHLTIRDPEHPELYWTNPMAIHFEQVSLRNLILVNHDGKVVEGDYAVNRAGFCPTQLYMKPIQIYWRCVTPIQFMVAPMRHWDDHYLRSAKMHVLFSKTTL